jgi:hypothetical protein
MNPKNRRLHNTAQAESYLSVSLGHLLDCWSFVY